MSRGKANYEDRPQYATDEFRRAAFDVATAVRRLQAAVGRLEEVTQDRTFNPARTPRPAWADLRDAAKRIADVLRIAPKEPIEVPAPMQ